MILLGEKIRYFINKGSIVFHGPDGTTDDSKIGPNSVDVTIAPVIRRVRPAYRRSKSPGSTFVFAPWATNNAIPRPYWGEPEEIPEGESISIKPGETILAVTNEHVGSRDTFVPILKQRSGTARIALLFGAGFGDVGYFRPWTLEIFNGSEAEILIPPGSKVAQVFFLRGEGVTKRYSGSYGQIPWTPDDMLPKLFNDRKRDRFGVPIGPDPRTPQTDPQTDPKLIQTDPSVESPESAPESDKTIRVESNVFGINPSAVPIPDGITKNVAESVLKGITDSIRQFSGESPRPKLEKWEDELTFPEAVKWIRGVYPQYSPKQVRGVLLSAIQRGRIPSAVGRKGYQVKRFDLARYLDSEWPVPLRLSPDRPGVVPASSIPKAARQAPSELPNPSGPREGQLHVTITGDGIRYNRQRPVIGLGSLLDAISLRAFTKAAASQTAEDFQRISDQITDTTKEAVQAMNEARRDIGANALSDPYRHMWTLSGIAAQIADRAVQKLTHHEARNLVIDAVGNGLLKATAHSSDGTPYFADCNVMQYLNTYWPKKQDPDTGSTPAGSVSVAIQADIETIRAIVRDELTAWEAARTGDVQEDPTETESIPDNALPLHDVIDMIATVTPISVPEVTHIVRQHIAGGILPTHGTANPVQMDSLVMKADLYEYVTTRWPVVWTSWLRVDRIPTKSILAYAEQRKRDQDRKNQARAKAKEDEAIAEKLARRAAVDRPLPSWYAEVVSLDSLTPLLADTYSLDKTKIAAILASHVHQEAVPTLPRVTWAASPTILNCNIGKYLARFWPLALSPWFRSLPKAIRNDTRPQLVNMLYDVFGVALVGDTLIPTKGQDIPMDAVTHAIIDGANVYPTRTHAGSLGEAFAKIHTTN